jgi:arabinogalactan endo-1,4-beta-galactosidase
MRINERRLLVVSQLLVAASLVGCGSGGKTQTMTPVGAAGSTVTGGASANAGASSAGSASKAGDGAMPSGGAAGTAGSAGASTTAGSAGSGGVSAQAGSAGTSGQPSGGSSPSAFMLGADISSATESSLTYRDVDGSTKSLLDVLKNHGFNYVRLKTFVDPNAPYGYSSSANGCQGLSEPFGDRDHVIAAGKKAKQAGMGFLLDLHYSDTWADPGNQIIPQIWRSAPTINDLAALMKAYTTDIVSKAIAAGARPDMIQIGNEITAGLLKDVPGASTDCWGNNPDPAPFGGSTSKWDDLATLLKAGIQAVRDVDPTIKVMLHIENTDDLAGVRWWVDNAQSRGVSFDVLGLSCYVAFQGQPTVWKATLDDLVVRYPTLKFAIAEYNPERTQANLIVKQLPDQRGLGTFFWEPTRAGEWGTALFEFNGNTASAISADFAEFDKLRPQLGL